MINDKITDTLHSRIERYVCTAGHNDQLFDEFTRLTDTVPLLKRHRDWVESNGWGYGDRALHYLWYLILNDLNGRHRRINALEIGVFKGQVISLWDFICRNIALDVNITAISPFEGNVSRFGRNVWVHRIRKVLDANYRRTYRDHNLHTIADYYGLNEIIFREFGLDFNKVRALKGYSNDPEITGSVGGERYDLMYIDGDHSYEGAKGDIENYSHLVKPGGYLVMDDASWSLPGNNFFKGFENVSRACELLPSFGFKNVLNIGHNRLYVRTEERKL